MNESAPQQPRIDDPLFLKAVRALDAGDAGRLQQLITDHPWLIRQQAEEDGSTFGAYFTHPYLMWFVADNPIRNGRLTPKVLECANVLIQQAREQQIPELQDQLDVTLSLIVSGAVPAKCGVSLDLIECFVKAGASPDCATESLLSGNIPEAKKLLSLGAEETPAVMAGLGEAQKIKQAVLADTLSEDDKKKALAMAAICGHPSVIFYLASSSYGGMDVNGLCPEGFHSHGTPLHHAASQGHLDVIKELVKFGADLEAKDLNWQATPLGWAEYCGQPEAHSLLQELGVAVPVLRAARAGDLEALGKFLDDDPEWLIRRLPEGTTLLSDLCDLNLPAKNPGETVRYLLGRGMDPNQLAKDPGGIGESVLHWAASMGDEDAAIEIIDALLDGGADINRLGGVETGGTPLHNASIFQLRKIGAYLLRRGAAYDIQLAAGNGRSDLVKELFDAQGEMKPDAPVIQGHNPGESAQHQINWAFYIAAMAGDVETLSFLYPKVSDFVTLPDGRTVVDRAVQHQHPEVEAWLRNKGLVTKEELGK